MGRTKDAERILTDLNQLENRRYVTRFAPAYVSFGLDQKNAALDWLEKAYEDRDSNLPYLNSLREWDPLRNEPRFQALVKKVENGGREK